MCLAAPVMTTSSRSLVREGMMAGASAPTGRAKMRSTGPPRRQDPSKDHRPIVIPVSSIYAARALIAFLLMVWTTGLGWHPVALLAELGALIFWAAMTPLPESIQNRPKR